MRGQKRQASGKMAIRYASRRSVCRVCPLRGRCLAGKGERREIERWTDEDVIERHRARMRLAGKDMMRRRKALAEHPFGTLKCRAGRHAAVRWPSRASIRALRRGLGYSEMTYRGRTFLPSLVCSTHPTATDPK